MTEKNKLNLWPLPEQKDDYSHLQEEEILWGRVLAVGVAILGTIAIAVYMVFNMFTAHEKFMQSTQPQQMPAQVQSHVEARSEEIAAAQPSAETELSNENVTTQLDDAEQSQANLSEEAPVNQIRPLVNKIDITPNPALKDALLDVVPSAPDLSEVISPVSTLHESLSFAALTHELDKGRPTETLGYNIAMTDEGIIRVMLYTEMQNLSGKVLYHDWYMNERLMARVRIPVRASNQNSHSSKFINAQMTGDWTVKVVDDTDELYAEAHFNVK